MSARRTIPARPSRLHAQTFARLMLPFFFTLAQAQVERTIVIDRLENVTHTVTRILDGYDIRLRPNFGGSPGWVPSPDLFLLGNSSYELCFSLKGVAAGTRRINEAANLALNSSNALVTDSNRTVGPFRVGYTSHSGSCYLTSGDPLYVGMDLTIASFDAISEVNMDYTITLYLNQYWKDERLAFGLTDEVLTLSGDFADKIWVPDTFFANDKNSFLHDVTERNKLVRLGGDGSITYGMRFTATLACMMDLHYYPLDSQNCTVEIESYGYTVSDVVMYWKETPVRGVEEAELPQFTILGHETNDRKEKLATGVYQRLSLSFKLRRNIGYFVFQTYLPSILIVMLSWVSFWINHEATSARVALGITTVLTMTTISTGVRSSLPRISYVKAIDIYLVMCFVFVFAALLEYAAVNYTYWGARARKRAKLKNRDQMSTSTSVEKDLKSSGGSRSPEEIIALRECSSTSGRVSPLLGLRSKPLPPTTGAPPSLRIQRDHSQLRYRTRPHSRTSKNGSTNKPKVIHALRRGATVIKASMPKIRDVNVIDTYSRVVFPVCFLIFNAVYWTFYIFD